MRSREVVAVVVRHSLGDKADKLTDAEVCRVYGRAMRARYSSGVKMSLAELVTKSRQRHRARITHPGKRR